MSHNFAPSLWVGRFLEWGIVDTIGIVRGIMLFWDMRIMELIGLVNGVFSISCLFKNVED